MAGLSIGSAKKIVSGISSWSIRARTGIAVGDAARIMGRGNLEKSFIRRRETRMRGNVCARFRVKGIKVLFRRIIETVLIPQEAHKQADCVIGRRKGEI